MRISRGDAGKCSTDRRPTRPAPVEGIKKTGFMSDWISSMPDDVFLSVPLCVKVICDSRLQKHSWDYIYIRA